MVKPKEFIYTFFNETAHGSGTYGCKFCPSKYRRHATRMTNHVLNDCKNIPPNLKVTLSLEQQQGNRSDKELADPVPDTDDEVQMLGSMSRASPAAKRAKQTTMDGK